MWAAVPRQNETTSCCRVSLRQNAVDKSYTLHMQLKVKVYINQRKNTWTFFFLMTEAKSDQSFLVSGLLKLQKWLIFANYHNNERRNMQVIDLLIRSLLTFPRHYFWTRWLGSHVLSIFVSKLSHCDSSFMFREDGLEPPASNKFSSCILSRI